MFCYNENALLNRNVFSCFLNELRHLWHAWQVANCSRGVEQHLNMLFLPVYVAYTVEPPADKHQRSVALRSVGNELVGQSSMMQLGREGFETSAVAVCTRSAV